MRAITFASILFVLSSCGKRQDASDSRAGSPASEGEKPTSLEGASPEAINYLLNHFAAIELGALKLVKAGQYDKALSLLETQFDNNLLRLDSAARREGDDWDLEYTKKLRDRMCLYAMLHPPDLSPYPDEPIKFHSSDPWLPDKVDVKKEIERILGEFDIESAHRSVRSSYERAMERRQNEANKPSDDREN